MTRPRLQCLPSLLILISSTMLFSQKPPQRDPQALNLLAQCGAAMGAASITDTHATGSMTTNDPTAPAVPITSESKGAAERFDFSFPSDIQTYALDGANSWAVRQQKQVRVPYAFAAYHRPEHVPALACALDVGKSNMSIVYLGQENFMNGRVHHVPLCRVGDDELRAGDVGIPDVSPLAWIGKIRGQFAWDKLAGLRRRALELGFPRTVGLLSEALVKIDRAKAAELIRKQADVAPPSWRFAQVAQAIEQEHTAKIEAAQQTPFEDVLRRLKGSTSINRLRVLCEGPTDRPIVESLIAQVGSFTNVVYGSVGGWGGLRAERDPNVWIVGCKEAVIIMDGDEGRRLTKPKKPYTRFAKEEMKKVGSLPIRLRILKRYGIENYFPQQVCEKVIGVDLSAYFPMPDHVSPLEWLSKSRKSLKYKLRKFVAKMLGFPRPSPKESLFSKSRNYQVAQVLKLQDLQGTDLLEVIEEISEIAQRLDDD